MSIWTFIPKVNGNSINDAKLEVEVPDDTQNVEIETYVDGVVLENKYWLPDKLYAVLKWIGLLALPTLAWAYQLLANTWGWPSGDEVAFTLNVVGTVVAVLIGASTLSNRFGE